MLEAVYQECLEKEFRWQGVPFVAQPPVRMEYKGEPIEHAYNPEFICYDKITVELKAVDALVDKHRAQAFNYLRATKMHLALLVNLNPTLSLRGVRDEAISVFKVQDTIRSEVAGRKQRAY